MTRPIIARIPWVGLKSNIHTFPCSRSPNISFFSMSRVGRRHFISRSPELYAETQNGQGNYILKCAMILSKCTKKLIISLPGEKISEEDLHWYTRHRWLWAAHFIFGFDDDFNLTRISRFNEEKELSKRYVDFDLQQLVRVAVSVCEGAQSCALLSLGTCNIIIC